MTPHPPELDAHMSAGLSHMSEMPRYMAWIVSQFRPPYGRLIEVGAGIGSYVPYYRKNAATVAVVEPSPEYVRHIRSHYPDVHVIESTIEAVPTAYDGQFDTVVSINSLEHFSDDHTALSRMAGLLAPGGRLCVYVPARRELQSKWDAAVGHYRRYTRNTLRLAIEQAELTVTDNRYSDLAGGIAWWISGRIGATPSNNRTSLSASMRVFDAVLVPMQRALETLAAPCWGKSLVCIASRTPPPTPTG